MGLPSYVINFDELSDLIKGYLEHGVNVDIQNISFNTTELERLLNDINNKIQGVNYTDLISALKALGVKLDALNGNLGVSGNQKMYGEMLEIRGVVGQQALEFTAPANGRITGITYSLSGWNYKDNWDLFVGNTQLFYKVRTKEYGEHKFFNVFYPVSAGQKIKLVFNNESGANKILWADFCILED